MSKEYPNPKLQWNASRPCLAVSDCEIRASFVIGHWSFSPLRRRLMRFLGAIVFCVAAGLAAKATEHDTTNHWSFQPVLRPAVPGTGIAHQAARNPIDSFVAAKLAENQL